MPHDSVLGPVDRADLVKGYEYEKGKYVIVEPAELDEIRMETNKTVEILKFVPADTVDGIYYDGFYYMAPDGAAAMEPFRVFCDAMARKNVVALARVIMSGRERIVLVQPRGAGMMLATLRYGHEVRSETAYFEDIKDTDAAPPMVELAEQLIDQHTGEFDPNEFSDRYGEAVLELVKSKLEGRPAELAQETESAGNIVNLMDALRQSVGESKGKKPAKSAAAPKRAAKRKAG